MYLISPLPLPSWNLCSFSFYCFGWEQLLVMTSPVFSRLLLQQQFMPFSLKLAGTVLSIFLFPLDTCNSRIRITASVLLKIMWSFYNVSWLFESHKIKFVAPAPGDPGAVLRLGREEWSGHTGDPLASDISRPAQSLMRGKACLCWWRVLSGGEWNVLLKSRVVQWVELRVLE